MLKCILVFVVPSLLQTLPIFNIIPRMLGAIIMVLLIIIILKRLSYKKILYLGALFLVSVTSILNSSDFSLNLKDLIYFSTFILFGIVLMDKKIYIRLSEILKRDKKLIKKIIYISNFIILISMVFPQGYYSNWGETSKYLKGFTSMPQVLAGICLFLIFLTMYYLGEEKLKKKKLFLYIVPTLAILASGSRTFLIPIVIMILVFIFKYFKFSKGIFILVASAPIVFKVIKESSIFDKFTYVLNFEYSYSLLSKLTSGRSDVWSSCISYYFNEFSLIEKLSGRSFDNVYNIINEATNMNIWAHNDIINLLISSGIIGVILYLFIFLGIIKVMKFRDIKIHSIIIFYLIYSFIMLTNGLYVSAMLVFSIFIFIEAFSGGRNEENFN